MDWAAAPEAASWGVAAEAVADPGPTMLSFASPSFSSSAAVVEQLQDRSRSASVTSRRGRAPGSAAGTVGCSVDGCRSDFSRCREYHRRHKVCEAHSKTPVVVVAGQEKRFCQQCSSKILTAENLEPRGWDHDVMCKLCNQPETVTPLQGLCLHQVCFGRSYGDGMTFKPLLLIDLIRLRIDGMPNAYRAKISHVRRIAHLLYLECVERARPQHVQ